MLRHRPRRGARRVLAHPAAGWLTVSVLYLVAVVLNVLLAMSIDRYWPLLLAAVLGGASGVCASAAVREFGAVARGQRRPSRHSR